MSPEATTRVAPGEADSGTAAAAPGPVASAGQLPLRGRLSQALGRNAGAPATAGRYAAFGGSSTKLIPAGGVARGMAQLVDELLGRGQQAPGGFPREFAQPGLRAHRADHPALRRLLDVLPRFEPRELAARGFARDAGDAGDIAQPQRAQALRHTRDASALVEHRGRHAARRHQMGHVLMGDDTPDDHRLGVAAGQHPRHAQHVIAEMPVHRVGHQGERGIECRVGILHLGQCFNVRMQRFGHEAVRIRSL